MAMPRARTQTGRNSCSSAIKVEITAVHANPAKSKIGSAARKFETSTITAKAAAKTMPAAISSPLVDRRSLTRPSTRAAIMAPAPSAPTERRNRRHLGPDVDWRSGAAAPKAPSRV